jgi:hypothetical protein
MPLETAVGSRVPSDTLSKLDEMLLDAFEVGTSLEILNTAQPEATQAALRASKKEGLPPISRAQALGESLAAQGTLFGVVSRFEDSDGSRFGASRPSSVGFKLWLFNIERREVVWSASYQNTEQSLSENLFRVKEVLKEGVGFRSSAQLARYGFTEAAKELERQRSAEGS